MHMSEMQKAAYKNSVEHGWCDPKQGVPEQLCLIHSEVSEVLQAYRDKNDNHIGEELADIVLRVMFTSSELNINLEEEILKKHEKNKLRPYRHGNKRC